ncbi:hypothetical protein [Burkholderia cenocepacia]|uniref:hypothetical protein n=1 Tax=Burkholderia cenocepacia TaxID=95486 RepID=UPI002ABE7916|nr:hypothetical protein [Burkholderia cenocepacia]
MINHLLEADCLHTLVGLGLDPDGAQAAAAHAHARQAGRYRAVAGEYKDPASGHISAHPPLADSYEAGYAEGERARLFGGLDRAALDACLAVRDDLDRAVAQRDAGLVDAVMVELLDLAVAYPGVNLPFFDDVPELNALMAAADRWRVAEQAWQARLEARNQAAEREAQRLASLPSAAELVRTVAAEANGEGRSFAFEGYTLWHEPEHGGWSLTNAYGVDNCALLSSERDFQRLLDAIKQGRDIGPVPPGCESPEVEVDDARHDLDAMLASDDAACAFVKRTGIEVDPPAGNGA